MRKSQANPTTTENLEAKFDRGEDVLDYFNVRNARVVQSQTPPAASKNKGATPSGASTLSSQQKVAVRDQAGRYRVRKKR